MDVSRQKDATGPPKLSGRVSVRFRPETLAELEKVAAQKERSPAWLIRKYVEQGLAHEKESEDS